MSLESIARSYLLEKREISKGLKGVDGRRPELCKNKKDVLKALSKSKQRRSK